MRKQIFYAMMAVSLTSILLLGSMVYGISKKTIENNYRKSHRYDLQVSSNIIDIQLDSIIEQGRALLENDAFKRAVTGEKSASPYFSSVNQLLIDNILYDAAEHDVLIDSYTVINENGNWRCVSKRNSFSGLMHHFYTTDDILQQPFIAAAREALGKEVFFGCNVMIPDTDTDTFSYAKNLIDPSTQKSMGFLVVNIRKKLLGKAFGSEREGYMTNRFMVIDMAAEQPVVYFNGSEDEQTRSLILSDYIADSGARYLFSSYPNSATGWRVVNVIEKSELSSDSVYIGWAILLACAVLFLLCSYASRLVSDMICRPLSTLERAIADVGEGNRHIEAEFDGSEIGLIGQKLKAMVNNNLELRERLLNSQLREKEAELLLLQAQINPHFLYNTLDSLYFMAVIKDDQEIADIVLALSNTFKLSLNKGEKLISVSGELMRMKEYMKIQNARYNGRFEFFPEIDESILDEKILTFILQPFVENAMYHGLEAKVGGGFIRVKGGKEGNLLRFSIEDNGVGIADLSVLEDGYGVKNVRERIKLFYGGEYGVFIQSEPGHGTKVSIDIPALGVKEEKL